MVKKPIQEFHSLLEKAIKTNRWTNSNKFVDQRDPSSQQRNRQAILRIWTHPYLDENIRIEYTDEGSKKMVIKMISK